LVDSWLFQIRLQRYEISLIFANKSALIFILSAKSLVSTILFKENARGAKKTTKRQSDRRKFQSVKVSQQKLQMDNMEW